MMIIIIIIVIMVIIIMIIIIIIIIIIIKIKPLIWNFSFVSFGFLLFPHKHFKHNFRVSSCCEDWFADFSFLWK